MKKMLMSHQSAFLQQPFLFPEVRYHFFVAGYSAGKTSCLASMLEFMVMSLRGKYDYENRPPRVLVGGLTIGHLLKTTIMYFLKDLTKAGIPYFYNKKDNVIVVDGVEIMMCSLSEPDKIIGLDVVGCLLDEVDELNLMSGEELAFEALKACNERTRQAVRGFRSPFLCLATTSQGQRGLYRIYTLFRKNGTAFTLLRGRSADNSFLNKKSPGYLASMERMLSPAERRVYLDGFFEAVGSGRVFPDFDWDRNYADREMDKEVADHESVYYSQDMNSGFNRGTAFIMRDGVVYAIKRYDFPDARSGPKVLRHDFPRNKIYYIPDATSNKDVLVYYRELRSHGINWIARAGNPNVEDTVFILNKLFYTGRMVFTKTARETAEACAGFMRDKFNQIPKGKGPRDLAHDVDSARYVANYLVRTKTDFLDILRISMGRNVRKLQDEPQVEELTGGYVDVKPI